MCGRFFNHLQAMHDWLDILTNWPGDTDLLSYNLAPTQTAPVIAASGLMRARWGLIPSWSETFENKYATFNAKIETISSKPTFRNAWRRRQTCLVPTAGYYEWKTENNHKQPYAVHHPHGPLVMLGLWEAWHGQHSFTIITQEAQGELAKQHHRMPLIVDAKQASDWLKGEMNPQLNTWRELRYYPVDKRVGNTRNDDADLIKAINDDPFEL